MKSSHVTALALVLLAGGFGALWWLLRDDAVATSSPAEEPDRSASTESSARGLERDDEDLADAATALSSTVVREGIAPPVDAVVAALGDRPRSVVHGRLRDEATAEALPDYLLRIADAAGQREDAVTDAQGNFATKAAMVKGTITIDFLDHAHRDRTLPQKRFDHLSKAEDAEYDLAVASGPTYWLDLQPAREFEGAELDVRLHSMGSDGVVVSEPEPVRTGERSWVRFGPIENADEEARGDSIHVTSRDGYWRGAAKVQDVHGRVPGIVAVKLTAFAVLKVHVAEASGSPVEGANLYLDGKNVGGKPRRAAGRTLADGTFAFKYVVEGDGTLALRSVFHVAQDVPVHLVAKQTSSIDAVLEKLPIAGGIRGRITSETGNYTPKVGIALSPPASMSSTGHGPAPLRMDVRWEVVGGRKVGLFALEGLPKGEYRLDLNHAEDFFNWDPPRLVLSPPNDAAEVLVHDAVPNASIAFRVRDGDNGLLLDGLRVALDIRGRKAPRILIAGSNQVLFEHVPYDRKITWRIDKEDYQPAFGDESSFIAEEVHGDHKVRYADIHLDPGWGDAFRVTFGQRNGGTPIAGAHILLDGREGGVTGKDGTVRVFAKKKPSLVQCTYNEWNVAGKIDLAPSWARADRNFIRIEMRPPPKK